MTAVFFFIAWASSLGLAFLAGYYVRGLQGPSNGNGGNGEEMQVRRVA